MKLVLSSLGNGPSTSFSMAATTRKDFERHYFVKVVFKRLSKREILRLLFRRRGIEVQNWCYHYWTMTHRWCIYLTVATFQMDFERQYFVKVVFERFVPLRLPCLHNGTDLTAL